MSSVGWDGDDYQRRFDDLASRGTDVHGEADLVMSFAPSSVLDAGCGTGRVAIELARRGVDVVGVDADPSMLATARRLAPQLIWLEADLTTLHLSGRFDVVVLAGNVPLFTPLGTATALVARCGDHVGPGGVLVAGFQLDRGVGLDEYDEAACSVGLVAEDRFATWDRQALGSDGAYAVVIHRRPV